MGRHRMIYADACETVTGMDVIMGAMMLGFPLILLALILWTSTRN